MPPPFDPYYKWLGIPPAEQPPNHYRLLGINLFEPDADVISAAADARMIHLRSFQTGQYAKESQRLLNEVAAARICLLRPEKKAEYDGALRHWIAAQHQPAATTPPAEPSPAPQAAYEEAAPAADPLDFRTATADPLDFTATAATPRTRTTRAKSPGFPVAAIVGPLIGVAVVVIAIVIFNSQHQDDADNPGAVADNSGSQPTTPRKEPDHRPNPFGPTSPNKLAGDPTKRPTNPASIVRPGPNDRPRTTGSETKPPDSTPTDNPGTKPQNTTPTDNPPDNPGPAKTPGDNPNPRPPDNDDTPPQNPALKDNIFVPAGTRAAVPTAEAQQKLAAKMRDILKDDFANAKTPEQRMALARKLVQLGRDTKDDMPMAYVMANQGLEAAVKGGDPGTAAGAVKFITESFDVDNGEVISKSLVQLSRTVKTPELRGVVAKASLDLVDPAIAAGKYDVAVDLASAAATLASMEKEPLARDMARDAAERARRSQRWAREYQTAIQKLTTDPDDAEANFLAGRAECFWKGDWTAGLSHLAKGSDESLKALAELEQKAGDSPDAMALADAWWDAADKRIEKGDKKDDAVVKAMRNRAGHWYRAAESGLTGLQAAKAKKRIEEAGAETGPLVEASSDVFLDDIREQEAHVHFGNLGKRGLKGYDPPSVVKVRGARPAHSLSMHPSESSPATVKYELPATFKVFTSQVALMDSATQKGEVTFHVIGDGKTLWTSRPLRAKGESQQCHVSVIGVKSLQIEVHCRGDAYGAHAVWLYPKLIK